MSLPLIWALMIGALAGGNTVGPDSLLREHRYPELARWVAEQSRHPTVPPRALAFYRGMLADHQNQNVAAIRDLAPLAGQLDPVRDSAHLHLLLQALGDAYTKTYRYGEAATALAQWMAHDSTLSADDRRDALNEVTIRRLLRDVPPQTVTLDRAFAVPVRRNAIGLLEAPVRVGPDSTWWILDTGANLSTITESLARRLGLSSLPGTATTKGVTGVDNPLHVAVIPELRLGAARIHHVVVLVLPDSALAIPEVPFQFNAILGYPVLEALDHLAMGSDSLRARPNPTGLPTAESNLYLDDLSPLVAVTIDDSTRLLMFDSGADHTTLSARFGRAYPARVAGLPLAHSRMGGAGGVSEFAGYKLAHLPVIVAGTRAMLDSVFVYRDSTRADFQSVYGSLASDIAAPFGGYTIDFRAMTFRLGIRRD